MNIVINAKGFNSLSRYIEGELHKKGIYITLRKYIVGERVTEDTLNTMLASLRLLDIKNVPQDFKKVTI